MPVMWKLSFTEMGRPWSRPRGWPVRARWASSSEARERAGAKRGSVRQLVSWWDMAARFSGRGQWRGSGKRVTCM